MRILTILFGLLILNACNSLSGIEIPKDFAQNLPAESAMPVKIISQYDSYSCATTSLAMVMSYHDKKEYDKFEVWDQSGSSIHRVTKVCGNDMEGLHKAAQANGFGKADFVQNASVEELKYLVSQGLPVVINIRNFRKSSYHAVVVSGYTADDQFIISDSVGYSYKVTREKLEKHWYASLCSPRLKRASRTMFVLYPKKS